MIAALLLTTAAALQDTTRLTLARTIERALELYPSVAAARAQRDRAAADLDQARSARLPRLTLDGSLNQFQKPNVVAPLHAFDPRNPPLFDRTLVQTGVSLTWTLYDFGGRAARIRAQRALGGAADATLSGTELQLVAGVVNAYLRVLTARGMLAAQDQRLTALASASDRTRQLFDQGKAARVDRLRVEAEVLRARADRIAGAAQVDVAEHQLAQLAQLPYDSVRATALSVLRLADTSLVPDTTAARRASLFARAREASPEVRELEQRAAATRAQLTAARAAWFPEFRLSGGFLDRGRWSGDYTGEWQIGVAVSYPIYTGGNRESSIRRAGAEDRAAAEQLRAAQLQSELGVDQALAALREAHARVAALQSAVDQSAEVARIERLALEVGSGTQSDYLDAEANLLRARADLIEARHAEISARVELARVLGELSPEWLARTVESAP